MSLSEISKSRARFSPRQNGIVINSIRHFQVFTVVLALALALSGVAAAKLHTHAQVLSSAPACTRLASASGNDRASGMPGTPFRTAAKLLSSLKAGDVGCLAAGQTFGSASMENRLDASDVTLQSGPGSPSAKLVGLLRIGGSRDVVAGLTLDGHNPPYGTNPATVKGQAGLFIVGDSVTVRGNDISNGHTATCVYLGVRKSTGAVIRYNRIHACGVLPHNRLEHGIYVSTARNVTIADNVIYDIADFGIQVYPDATNTLIQNNLIDNVGMSGVVVGSESGPPTSGTVIKRNIITHAAGQPVVTYWGGTVGSKNVASDNCDAADRAQGTWPGLTVQSEKKVADAGLDANMNLREGAACAGYGPASIQYEARRERR